MPTPDIAANYYLKPADYSLSLKNDFYRMVTQPDQQDVSSLAKIAPDSGFSPVMIYQLPKGAWHIFERPTYDLPLFPKGRMRTNSALAFYQRPELELDGSTQSGVRVGNTPFGETRHFQTAIMQTSSNPLDLDRFTHKLQQFSTLYLERPFILGLPSEALTGANALITGGLIGGALGAPLGPEVFAGIQDSPPALKVFIGIIAGMETVGAAALLVSQITERVVRKKLGDLSTYIGAERALRLLQTERYGAQTVLVEREVNAALREQGINLSQRQFIAKLHGNLPKGLMDSKRHEIERKRRVKVEPHSSKDDVLPQLVEAAKEVLAVA